jgi:CRISPR/Cas system endoribonuclease Cas6 (RAMP superfamily)
MKLNRLKKQYVTLNGCKCEGTKEQVLALKAKISEFVRLYCVGLYWGKNNQLYWDKNKRVKPAIIKAIVYELFDLHQDDPKFIIEELTKTMVKKIEEFKTSSPSKEELNLYPTLFWDGDGW